MKKFILTSAAITQLRTGIGIEFERLVEDVYEIHSGLGKTSTGIIGMATSLARKTKVALTGRALDDAEAFCVNGFLADYDELFEIIAKTL